MVLTTARLRDYRVDLAIPTLLRGRTIEGFCVGSASRAPSLERDCTTNNERWGNSVYRRKMYTHTDENPVLKESFAFALRFELVGGRLRSGIGLPIEQTWVGNPKLKGADR